MFLGFLLRWRHRCASGLCVAMLLLGQGVLAATPAAGTLHAASPAAFEPALRAPDGPAMAARLYAAGEAPRWLADGQAQAELAVRLLGDAAAHGLDPRQYDAAALALMLDRLRGGHPDPAFERDLSAAMLAFLSHLHLGRVDSPYRRAQDPASGLDLVETLRRAVNERRLMQAVGAAAPGIPLYERVRSTLAHYRELAGRARDWPALAPAGTTGVVAGSPYAGAALLRQRLRLLGDLAPDAAPILADDDVYDADLALAVRRFQLRHGLTEDGVLGPATLAALAVPPARRVDQLTLTLERLRWLPPQAGGRLVAINLPAYRLWAVDQDDASAETLEMRVIVGKAAGTPTPLFIGQMLYLDFNPYWNVPRSIALGEIVPKLARNPRYLEQNDMELVSDAGRPLAVGGAEALARIRAGTARVRQRPGAMNVLGEVKFALPNPMNIYLHSTSSKNLFQRTRRDLSHGCIRVERPAELAQFVLADPQAWPAAEVAAAMQPGPTRRVALPKPVPVILFYATAVTDREGRALFADDIYRLDGPLLQALRGD